MTIIRFTLVLVLAIYSNYSTGQTFTFSSSTDTYTHISGDTIDESIFTLESGEPVYESMDLGFTIMVDTFAIDSIQIAENGYIKLIHNGARSHFIMAFDCNLKNFNDSVPLSPIVYRVDGSAGNRIFKCEYVNAGFFDDPENDDSVNFQVWIYEGCGVFEIRYGLHSINSSVFWNGYDAPFVGYGEQGPITSTIWYLEGTPSFPVLQSVFSQTLTGPPANGQVYRFSSCPSSINVLPDLAYSVFPNPAEHIINVESEASINRVNIYESTGKLIMSKVASSNKIKLEIQSLPKGLYFLEIWSKDGKHKRPFIKV